MKSLFELLEEDTSERLISAIFMTYGFDAELFERNVLPAIFRLDSDFYDNEKRFRANITENLLKAPVVVLVDGSGYQGGKTLLYDLVNVTGCTFHPKCFLLLYQDYLRIIIGSSNITKPGMCYNAELFWQYDLREGDKTGVAANLKGIIDGMIEYISGSDIQAFKAIHGFLDKFEPVKYQEECIIHSTLDEKSFLEKLVETTKNKNKKIKNIRVISPFYESDIGLKKTFERVMAAQLFAKLQPFMLENAKVEIFFPGFKEESLNKWNVEAPLELFRELSKSIDELSFHVISNQWLDEEGEEHLRNLHAKLIEVYFENGEYLYLVGSANFTKSAMSSKKISMNNLEIGVFEISKSKLQFPVSIKVRLEDLIHLERNENNTSKPVIFIDKAVLDIFTDSAKLKITIKKEKVIYPFTVMYQGKEIYKSLSLEKDTEIIIYGFQLGLEKDLVIKYGEESFVVPIQINQKYLAAKDDLGFDFDPMIADIISFYSGRYRSIEELVAEKRRNPPPGEKSQLIIKGFRTNLNLFFKAMDGLKQSLEKPCFSEEGFKYELISPIGINKLAQLFDDEYRNGNLEPEEAFFYVLEMIDKIEGLEFQPDRLEKEKKLAILTIALDVLHKTLNDIYESSEGSIKKQYDMMLKMYKIMR